ncbi:MAG: DNA topology modulation protein [Ruminococcaceae bacterium]|nr:DNA topology modulation protein [Oscillospiraceae bacterium]
MRIAILGHSGSGKSTLARKIGELYDLPVLHLDTLQFESNWVERDKDEARLMCRAFMDFNDSWVIDGNYTWQFQQERLDNADLIVFMLFNRFNCLYRAFKRYKNYKGKSRPDMTDGCDEKLDREFITWILFSSRTAEKEEKRAFLKQKYASKMRIIKNQRQLDRFIAEAESLSLSGQLPKP